MKLPELNEESPINKAFYEFDIANASLSELDYKLNAVDQQATPMKAVSDLLIKEIHWRKDHNQNIVASIEGSQGSGKSMPFSYFGLLIASIFNEKFTPEHVFFTPEDLDFAIQNAKKKETFLRDEHLFTRAGLMSNFVEKSLSDYEEQLRFNQNNLLFCSVNLQNHSHFFCFESKHIIFDDKGYPKSFICMLKTPRYTDRSEFVWRGYINFPMPNTDFVEGYLKRKEEHIKNLKNKYGNTLNPVNYFAEDILKEKEKQLVMTTKEGFIKPIKSELMQFVIHEKIGTRKFTIAGYKLLEAKLKQLLIEKYVPQNELIFKRQEELRLNQNKKVSDILKEKEEILDKRRERKDELFKLKLEEEKRKNDLKERDLMLKKELLELKKNEKLK